MNRTLQRMMAWALCLFLPLVVVGCGDGGKKTLVPLTTMTVVATGPIGGAAVEVYQLLPDGRSGSLLGVGTTGGNGQCAVRIPTSTVTGPLLARVAGKSGAIRATQAGTVPFNAGESYRATVTALPANQTIVVGALTEAAYVKLQQILTENPAYATTAGIVRAVDGANDRIAELFGVSALQADVATDSAYQTAVAVVDRILAGSGVADGMNFINQALADVTAGAFQSMINAVVLGANQVKLADPSLTVSADALVALFRGPVAELDWSDATPPATPAGLAAAVTPVTATTGTVTLSWSAAGAAEGVVGYDVFRNGGKVATVTTNSYSDIALPNAAYSYYVVAFDAVGNRSPASAPVNATLGVPDTAAPTAPATLTASTFILSATDASVVLMWSPSIDNVAVSGYDVYRDGVKIATTTVPGYTVALVAVGALHTYHVVAFDPSGNRSVASPTLNVTPNQPTLGVTVNGRLGDDVTGLPQNDLVAPTAPGTLTASTSAVSATQSQVQLAWGAASDDTGVAGYEVYRDGTKIVTTTLLGYTDFAVVSTVTYNYFIIAFDAAGNRSIAGNQLLVTPNQASLGVTVGGQIGGDIIGLPGSDISAPSVPVNLSASTSAVSATQSAVLLAWSPASDNVAVTGYEVYRNGSKIATVTVLGYLDPLVTSNVTYSYTVVAVDGAGNRSAASAPLAVTPNQSSLGVTVGGQLDGGIIGLPTNDISAPTVPSGLSASTSAVSATQSAVLLSWSPASDNVAVTGYEVYRNGSKIATTTLLGYLDPLVISNVTYSYTVVAFDGAGNRSAVSVALAVTPNQASLGVTVGGQLDGGIIGQPQNDIVAPSVPSGLSASTSAVNGTQSAVLLAWAPASDNVAVTGYEVYRNGVKIATVTVLAYLDPLVLSTLTYNYSVVAMDGAGNRSAASAALAVTPNQASLGVTVGGQLDGGILGQPQSDITPPAAPGNLLAATSALSTATSSVLLTWNPASDNVAVTGYEVYRDGSKLATVTTLGYLDPVVASGSTFSYTVVAFDAAGNRSPASAPLAVTPNQPSLGVSVDGQLSGGILTLPGSDITAPSVPANLSATANAVSATTSSVQLSWSAATDDVAVTGYDVYRDGVKIATVIGTGHFDPSLTADATYNYTVVAFDAAGNRSLASAPLAVTPPATVLGVTFSGQLDPAIIGY